MNDIINGLFELGASLFGAINLGVLWRDKKVRGFSKVSFSFFVLWGYWNLHYYPSLNQWVSFIGGILLTTVNTAWILLAIYYSYFKREDKL